jgi:Zn-dependent M16 (insulinase) family peptidase
VQGGAYGGSSSFDPQSRILTFLSYRDPNLLKTLDAYDAAAGYLAAGVGEQDLVRSIIGVVGTIDTHRLPDAKGFAALIFHLMGESEETRQQRREEVLGASAADFRALGAVLAEVARHGEVTVLGSETALRAANAERPVFSTFTKVL